MDNLAIDHVQLPVPAGEQALLRHFYAGLLGLQERRGDGGAALRFAAGPQRLDFLPVSGPALPARASHLALRVRNLPGLRARLAADGWSLDAVAGASGAPRFYVRDPAGHLLELLEAPPATGGLL